MKFIDNAFKIIIILPAVAMVVSAIVGFEEFIVEQIVWRKEE